MFLLDECSHLSFYPDLSDVEIGRGDHGDKRVKNAILNNPQSIQYVSSLRPHNRVY